MSEDFRLAAGGRIDRSRPIAFTFDGRGLTGFAGDTLASALVANGVRLLGRSFKYHRPRGLLSAGPEEPNALVELREGARREPNTRATTVELFDGLVARSQNRWPSLRYDLLSLNSLAAPVLAAGFYYKTFMWPKSFWEKVYEPLIRRAAGLGRAAIEPDPDAYEKAYLHCDVLIIGAGPAGLAAARAAARAGARVALCDEDFEPGGRLLSETHEIDGAPGAAFAGKTSAELRAAADVTVLPRTTVFGVYDHGVYAAIERVNDHLATPPAHQPRQRFWTIRARTCVLAAGAIERPIVFGDNDLPGVMLAGAVRGYVNRFAALPGRRAAIFANNDDAAGAIAALKAAGAALQVYVDPRGEAPAAIRAAAEAAGARYVAGVVTRARGSANGVQAVDILGPDGRAATIDCDLLAMSGGWSPTIHLTSHLGGRPEWSEALAAFTPGELPKGMRVAGAAAGAMTLREALSTGAAAGAAAAADCGFSRAPDPAPRASAESAALAPLWRVRESRGKAFVDFQNDVAVSDVELAEREGYRSVEHLKRYTTLGMATDQGKTANVNGLALMAELTRQSIPQTGATRFRSPYTPVAIGAVAGIHRARHGRPTRLGPGHSWAREAGCVFIEAGPWMRPQYFPRAPGEDWLPACNREVLAVREGCGFIEVSTLGKIDVQGADAGVFLDRLYCNTFSTTPVGKARYGLMLREDGVVFDDGTTSRLAADRFFLTTTTAKAVAVMQHMDFCHQALWPDLDVSFVSVSEQWAQYSIAGPRAREVARKLVDRQHDISNEAFPYMAACEATVCGGAPARIYRISFSGELAYEIGVPARFGDAFARAIAEAGATPYGLEALSVMRIEKGHVGAPEINGQTTARDIGLGKMMSTKKDYVGAVMARRPAFLDPNRPTLVGLRSVDRDARFGSGAHFFAEGAPIGPETDEGHVTSACWSPVLGSHIGLGLLRRGPSRHGEILRACDPLRGRETRVEICSPHFHDPLGERLRA